MPEIRYYAASNRQQPFDEWFADLTPVARAKVTRAIVQLEQGNFSNVKSVGEDMFEYRISFGPGYRVYFGHDGPTLVTFADRRHEEAPAARHRCRACAYWPDYKKASAGSVNGDEYGTTKELQEPG